MNKLMISVLTAGSMIAMAASAAAQTGTDTVTGTVNITGSVAPKCLVVSGEGVSSSFTANVNLEELAGTDGKLKASSVLAAKFDTAGGAALSAKVVCTSALPGITVQADSIKADAQTAVSGYADTVLYQADVAVTTVNNTTTYSDDSAVAAPTGSTALNGRLANTASNILVKASNFRTADTNALLVADSYTGKITVTIAPSA